MTLFCCEDDMQGVAPNSLSDGIKRVTKRGGQKRWTDRVDRNYRENRFREDCPTTTHVARKSAEEEEGI